MIKLLRKLKNLLLKGIKRPKESKDMITLRQSEKENSVSYTLMSIYPSIEMKDYLDKLYKEDQN